MNRDEDGETIHDDDNCDATNAFLCPGPRVCAAAARAEEDEDDAE